MKTIRKAWIGAIELRLVDTGKALVGVLVQGGKSTHVEGGSADQIWTQLHNEVAKTNPKYVGFTGARSRFLRFFPNGFGSDGYKKEERNYKVTAKERLDLSVPLDQAASGLGFGEAVLAVFRATNLLSPFEQIRIQNLLRSPAADSFVQAVARFATAPSSGVLLDLERILRPHDAAKWTIVTYLPFVAPTKSYVFEARSY